MKLREYLREKSKITTSKNINEFVTLICLLKKDMNEVAIPIPKAYNPKNKTLLKKIAKEIFQYLSDTEQSKGKIDYSKNDELMDLRSAFSELENGDYEKASEHASYVDIDISKMIKKLKG